jgi:hypothetical protein
LLTILRRRRGRIRDESLRRHLRRAGHERRERAHEPDEAADEDRLASVAGEVPLDLLDSLSGELDPRAVLDEEVAAEPAAEQE